MPARAGKNPRSRELTMETQLAIIDNLGLKMYTTLPPVISELVANSWDAEAKKVSISIPKGTIDEQSEIVVKDNGSGMTFDEINKAYMIIGRNRRKESHTEVTPKLKRTIMGCKGIGKLAVFGVAREVILETVSRGKLVTFTMLVDDIRSTPLGQKYKPKWTEKRTTRARGTKVRLRKLNRRRAIDIPAVRRGIARRFSVIDKNFAIAVNGSKIRPKERDLRKQVQYDWDIDESIGGSGKWRVTGWIGTMKSTVPESIGHGVVIMARGKLAQEPTLFGVSGGRDVANPYIVGEIHAEFLDADKDLISTYRGSVVWESEEGQALRAWGQGKIKQIANEWSRKRRQEKEEVIREDPAFKDWLKRLHGPEKKLANKVIRGITGDETLPKERVLELASFMKESFEFQAFREMANELDNEPSPNDSRIIELFEEWRLIEAREVLRIAEGRVRTIEKLEQFIISNAREVPDIHNFLAEYPWIIDPTWTIASNEAYYSKLLRRHFPDKKLKESNRRIDFVCLGAGDTIHVVELKRPKHKINLKDLDQLEGYVDFVRQRLGNAPQGRSFQDAAGYIIGEDISSNYRVAPRMRRLKSDRIYVKKYADLLSLAERLHKEFRDRLGRKKK